MQIEWCIAFVFDDAVAGLCGFFSIFSTFGRVNDNDNNIDKL